LIAPGAVQVATRGNYGPEMIKIDFLGLTILNMVVLTTLLVSQAGGTSVILDTADAEQIADWIQRERGTVFQGEPAVLHSMVVKDSIRAEQLATVREVLTGSAATPEPLLAGFRKKFGLSIVGTYGMTEAPTMFAMEAPDGSDHAPDSSGIALPHIKLFAESPDGKRLPPGENGELCARPVQSGPWAGVYNLMLGYWNKPEATEAALKGGALHSGDIGYLDAAGRVYITDRKNLMINRGGANVYPAEIHRVLATDPRVADSATFGIPDERLGERVVAAVELVAGAKATEEELRALCERELARYKVPERIIFVAKFPRNAMNKIVRAELPKLYAEATRPA
jgi:acyl-CoA synthetase (AMP-forming)/AMP-acid ligase II